MTASCFDTNHNGCSLDGPSIDWSTVQAQILRMPGDALVLLEICQAALSAVRVGRSVEALQLVNRRGA